ncbi:MAG: hypothetical protein RMJ33_13190 [Saprospiraceae bacterium]|nr:T9SS type A sorting domain-containing protein [Saprospiraceae bacterium]MDW8230783.1 hypothetical protein [Saprospiraceae bacterium]
MRIPKVFSLLLWLLASTLPLAAQVAPCTIPNVEVEVGDCTSDSTFEITLNFKPVNPTSNEFEVFGNGVNLGTYKLSDLPLTIKNFPTGAGIGSFVRVCLKSNATNTLPCCGVKQFFGPDCSKFKPCEIYDVKVSAGDCEPGGKYPVKLDFKVKNPTSQSFEVRTSNNVSLGVFPLSGLPIVLTLPGSSQATETLHICLKGTPDCCTAVTIVVPPCPPPAPCAIRNLRVETGACTSDSTYKIVLNFAAPVTTPGTAVDSFDVYAANGQYLGRYAIANLPIALNFPWNGKNVDAVKVCLKNTNCCRRLEFNAPDCIAKPCGIGDVKVEVGECLSPNRYRIKVLALFSSPISLSFKVRIQAGNGDDLGIFDPKEFPVGLIFPASGDDVDRLKICILNPNGVEICCKIVEFKAPNCNVPPCPISDLKVEVAGPCNPDGTYPIVINFNYTGPTPAAFGVWSGDGKLLGIFPIGALPVKIAKFPGSGKNTDKVRVCIISPNAPSLSTCCLEAEFKAPDCQNAPCGIANIKVEVGPCNPDGTYRLVLNFLATSTQGQFGLWAGNGQFLGIHPFSALPLTIPNFPGSGKDVDAIRICVLGPAGTITTTCCIVHEFKAPNCQDCKITDLTVKVGDCNNDGTFKLQINFKAHNTGGGSKFTLWVNGVVFGTYDVSQLPLTIPNFPGGNGNKAEIRVCIISPSAPTCCAALTFVTPNCQGQGCKIEDLTVKTGDCNNDGTYKVQINFKAISPAPGFFSVWANGNLIGTYPISALPLTIPNFPASGKPKDVVKVCIVTPNAVQPLCCESLEFDAPKCSGLGCKITDLTVKTGDCNNDGTYRLSLNFKVDYPLTVILNFSVWGNGKFLGTYSQADLPLKIPNFPASGKPKDVIKVCVLALGSTQPLCCAELEFDAPNCAGKPCEIWDVKVQATPCLCGQFFAVLTFRHQNGSANGFQITDANGDVIASFPYSQQQPIILGPFDGDGKTPYVFVVQDKDKAGCSDYDKIGVIDCPDFAPPAPPTTTAVALNLSPNPATNWVTVMAKSQTGATIGQAVAEVRKPDGRLMRTEVVPNGNLFTLNVAELPTGIYRLSVQTAEGRYESTFVKQ